MYQPIVKFVLLPVYKLCSVWLSIQNIRQVSVCIPSTKRSTPVLY